MVNWPSTVFHDIKESGSLITLMNQEKLIVRAKYSDQVAEFPGKGLVFFIFFIEWLLSLSDKIVSLSWTVHYYRLQELLVNVRNHGEGLCLTVMFESFDKFTVQE